MKLRLWHLTLAALVAFMAVGTASAQTSDCLEKGQLPGCHKQDVPPPGGQPKQGEAKVIAQPAKAPSPSFLDDLGAFFAGVGSTVSDGADALGKGAAAAFVGLGGLVVAALRPLAELLAALRPKSIPVPLFAGMMASGTGAAAAGAQYGLLALWRRLFPLGLPLLGLFSRIDKDELLEHERRARIYELIKENPGIHLSEIARELQYAWGTTLHHLRKLRADHLILFKDIGHHKSFFINGSGLSEKQMEALSIVKNGTLAHLAHYLEDHPRTSLKELSEALNISPPLAAFHIRKLEKAGLVQKVRDGKSVRLSTTQVVPSGFYKGLAEAALPEPAPVALAS